MSSAKVFFLTSWGTNKLARGQEIASKFFESDYKDCEWNLRQSVIIMDKSDAIYEMTFQCSKELKDFSDTDPLQLKFFQIVSIMSE